jgi:hypothetical protein
LPFGFEVAGVDDVQQQIGVSSFFKGGTEGGDEVVGKVADEANGIAEQDIAEAGYGPATSAGVEGGEEFVFDQHIGAGERPHECALSGVGIAHERDGGLFAAE